MGRKSIAEIRREEIIQAFYEVVSEKGYGSATIREIAQHAGCSYRMLHHYFANKEEIVVAFLRHLETGYMSDLENALSECTTATDSLNCLFSTTSLPGRFSLEFCRAWVDCWALAKAHPSVASILEHLYTRFAKTITKIIREGIKSGEFRKVQPDLAANLIVASAEGLMALWVVNTENIEPEKLWKPLTDIWLDGLSAER